MADFNEQLERRGAAHQNIWKWCENVLNIYKKFDEQKVSLLLFILATIIIIYHLVVNF